MYRISAHREIERERVHWSEFQALRLGTRVSRLNNVRESAVKSLLDNAWCADRKLICNSITNYNAVIQCAVMMDASNARTITNCAPVPEFWDICDAIMSNAVLRHVRVSVWCYCRPGDPYRHPERNVSTSGMLRDDVKPDLGQQFWNLEAGISDKARTLQVFWLIKF